MKILYIYHEYGGRRKRYGNEMLNLGHEVKFLHVTAKTEGGQISTKQIKKFDPDLIWLLSPHYLYHSVIRKEAYNYIKAKGIPLVLYSTLITNIPYIEMKKLWKKFDFLFVHSKPFHRWLKTKGLNSYYMPIGFYPDLYPLCKHSQTNNLSFMGSPQSKVALKYDKRVKYIKLLEPYGMKVYGKRFSRVGVKAVPFGTHEQQRSVYSSTKVNLDLPYVNSPLPFYDNFYHIKNRFFEVPATGNFLLTVRCEEFLDIFDESMVGYYDDNPESLVDTVQRYLKDKKIRMKMSEKSHKVVVENHTFGHRFRQMFKILKKAGI